MPCRKPMLAWQTASGDIVFVERLGKDVVRELQLPCKQCIGCRLERSRQWAMRCLHEASLHERKCFVTLTYDKVPINGDLYYTDFQKFIRRLRKKTGEDIRYYMCGEYGEETQRPHFHAILFGIDFDDKILYKNLSSGFALYTSKFLERMWGYGFCPIGDVTFESAGYVARYCVQKITGDKGRIAERYGRFDELSGAPFLLTPEFNKMSLKPGIGAPFLEKWRTDIYPHDYVIVRGQKMNPPKYYDRLYADAFPDDWDQLQFEREKKGRANYEDNTDDRLAVKAVLDEIHVKMLIRKFE